MARSIKIDLLRNGLIEEWNQRREEGKIIPNFCGVDLSGVDLRGANLSDAKLRGALNLSCAQLKSAKSWESAYRDEELACGAEIPTP